ncbi:TetR/AcrR family transcriptional regulator [Pollutimonas bauzanensis]|uniref:Transcriptional regulator, TetR family n=1 Tax=Pollutimonas bauzanensis TaxID=658167 RepID=A0A1M5W2R7_9BURK|nr:TetR/AcrR family transcriptional regulator [Pollutimonas bauzanensis]SHH81728.1 transcriptional regulator, TetR family [Pollutimonas bauzanensis]
MAGRVRRAADSLRDPDGQSPSAMARPRTKAPQARRADLMAAAEHLFVAKGIAATSVDDIAAGAQVAKGTFYLYFASKEAMLAALQERFVEGFFARLEQAMARHRPDNWKARLRAWVKAGLDTYFDQVALHDVIFHEFRPENRREMSDNVVVRQLAVMLQSGAQAGVWTVDDPHRVAVMLFNALHGLADDAVSAGEPPDRAYLVQILTHFCERALERRDG